MTREAISRGLTVLGQVRDMAIHPCVGTGYLAAPGDVQAEKFRSRPSRRTRALLG